MRLLIITVLPPMKAPEADHAFYLCEQLGRRGVDLHVLTAAGSAPLQPPNVQMHSIMRDWSWWDLPRLASCVKRCAPDAILIVYIGWVFNHHPMMTFAAGVCKAVCPGAGVVTQFENAYGAKPAESRWPARVLRRIAAAWFGSRRTSYEFGTLLSDSDRVVVLSGRHLQILSRHAPEIADRTAVIPPPPLMRITAESEHRAPLRQSLGLGAGDSLIAYLGYVYPSKGIETLLDAFALVSQQHPGARLVLIGGTPGHEALGGRNYANELRAQSQRLAIDTRVVWTGGYEWDSETPSSYLRASDLCVFPFHDGVYLNNSSFAAAAAHGLPIVATRADLVEAPFKDGENVFLCRRRDPHALASAITTVLEDPVLAQRLRSGALAMADEWYSWDRAATRTMEVVTLAKR
jgi:glycosyltransferase involved in cell wall biosynthesis